MILDCAVYREGRRDDEDLSLHEAVNAGRAPDAFVWTRNPAFPASATWSLYCGSRSNADVLVPMPTLPPLSVMTSWLPVPGADEPSAVVELLRKKSMALPTTPEPL